MGRGKEVSKIIRPDAIESACLERELGKWSGEFRRLAEEWRRNGSLSKMRDAKVDWTEGVGGLVRRRGEMPSESSRKLEYLEGRGLKPGVRGFVVVQPEAICELAQVGEIRELVFAGSEWVKACEGDVKEVLGRADWVGRFMNGWGGHGSAWERLLADIILRAKKVKGLKIACVAMETIPYGFAGFKPGRVYQEAIHKAGVLSFDGIGMLNDVRERALGISKKREARIGHSWMGALLLNLPQWALDNRKKPIIALMPAIVSGKLLGNYRVLEAGSRLSGELPVGGGFSSDRLVELLTRGVDSQVVETHKAVSRLMGERGQKWCLERGIGYLADNQGLEGRRRWPPGMRVMLGGKDVLVNSEEAYEELLRKGVRSEQISYVPVGHYGWAEVENGLASNAARERIIEWVVGGM